MDALFDQLEPADYLFLAELLRSPLNVYPDRRLVRLATAYDESGTAEDHRAVHNELGQVLGYLGSSDLAFAARRATGGGGALELQQVVEDVARVLGVRVTRSAPLDRMVAEVAVSYASVAFGRMDRDEQQRLLVELGVDADQAVRFVGRSAGVFALPVAISFLSKVVVEGIIKRIILGTIARIVGEKIAGQLLALIIGRLPWWVSWVGPAAWAGSIGWTALDLQGPARRKTIPAVLYLGLCVVRKQGLEYADFGR